MRLAFFCCPEDRAICEVVRGLAAAGWGRACRCERRRPADRACPREQFEAETWPLTATLAQYATTRLEPDWGDPHRSEDTNGSWVAQWAQATVWRFASRRRIRELLDDCANTGGLALR